MTDTPLAPDDPALVMLRQLEALLRAALGEDALILPPQAPVDVVPLGVAAFIPVPGSPAPMNEAARIIAAARDAMFCYGPMRAEPPAEPGDGEGFWEWSGAIPEPPALPEAPPITAEAEAGPIEGVGEADGTIAFTDPATGATARIVLASPVPDALWPG